MKNIIDLKGVWKVYRMGEVDVPALRGIDLEIKKGEFLAIIGPSGSGKSTMMNLVGCLDSPTRGKILLDGRDITEFSESELAQTRGQKIGFVFQQFNLIPTLTALENVMLPLAFQNVDDAKARKKAIEILNLVGLKERMKHLPNQLSGGERQRVSIARALSVDPEVILADEPTGNLDSRTGEFIIEFLGKIHREEKKTIIMVTHDMNLAKHAEKMVRIKDGQIEKIERRGSS
ncbi:MAG: ABC transporter ATP-binding protein [Candidatus Aenigmarchaeota archaeon]|nr:ABC transporter ATP-binding protein [Candidatus Aenigmarchaeota archaeon]